MNDRDAQILLGGLILFLMAALLGAWLGGCAAAQPARSTSIRVDIEAENITVTSEGESMSESGPRVVYIKGADAHSDTGSGGEVDESQEATGGEATADIDATVPLQ